VGPSRYLSERALRIQALSRQRWGEERSLDMVGFAPSFLELQAKLEKVADYQEPVLITGESGVGKEQLAQAVYLLGYPATAPFVSVNCPQYQDGNLTVSELFGHTRGAFTGAVADRRGAFEEADGGVIFLDEIGDLHPSAQAMLLRTLSTGEYRPLGASRSRSVRVRVVAATNRPLNQLLMTGQFRTDLLFRLRRFHLEVPPLRERGDDWILLVEHNLERLRKRYGVAKRFSSASLARLERYRWPGNIRQLISVVTTGYAMAEGDTIEPRDFVPLLEEACAAAEPAEALYDRVVRDGEDFWQTVYEPFMARDLNRREVRNLIARGLAETQGNYRKLLALFRLPDADYQRFMDFLRHQNLKPQS